jgi:PKD repeat protein
MGDGTTYVNRSSSITHTFAGKGTFTIRAYDWNGDLNSSPVSLTVTVVAPIRTITHSPQLPYVDQEVLIQAVNFRSGTIDWNFGDGTPTQTYSTAVSHRYPNPGMFTITAVERGMDLAPLSRTITILPENRSLELSVAETRIDEPVTVSAINFRSLQILWDFGDGTVVSGPPVMAHIYKLPGIYVISARDENEASDKSIQTQVRVRGISD